MAEYHTPICLWKDRLREALVEDHRLPGVHVLSVGSLTQTVRSADFSLLVD